VGKFVLVYTGGSMAETPEEQEAVMAKWMQWFGEMGESVLDGGNPFGASTSVTGAGASSAAKLSLTGYTIVSSDSLDSAAKLVAGCPVLSSGGAIEIYEAMDM
jgi:hypothetical protein